MSDELGSRARRGREVEVQEERRRRKGAARGQRLFVDESKLDPAFRYYWAINEPARIYQLTTQDDYVIVPPDEIGGVRTEHQLRGGDGEGHALGQILLKKRRDWHEADASEKQDELTHKMEGVRLGEVTLQDEQGAGPNRAYKPRIENALG